MAPQNSERVRMGPKEGHCAIAVAGALAAASTWGGAYLAPSTKPLVRNSAVHKQAVSLRASAPSPDVAAQQRPSSFNTRAAEVAIGAFAGLAVAGMTKKRSAKVRPTTLFAAEDTDIGGGFSFNDSDLLGSGAYGKVYKCRDGAGKEYAMKQVFSGGLEALEAEISTHKHIGKHENIVELIEVFDVPGITDKRLVMELARGGELSELLEEKGKLSEEWSKGVFQQIVSAVVHMHEKRTMHRDLKTDNVLLCTDSTHDADHPFVKLIDFGAAHWAKEEDGPFEAAKFIGSIQTISPEVIASRGDEFDVTDESQIATTHEITYKKRPFGIRKYRPGPEGIGAKVKLVGEKPRYPGDPIGQAFAAGVQVDWAVKTVNGEDAGKWTMDNIIDRMGDRLLDNSSRGAFDGSYAVTGDNKGKGKVAAKVEQVELPVTVVYAEMKPKPYGPKADVWSLGAILYNMVTGNTPFEPSEESVLEGKYTKPEGTSAELVDLLDKMLVVDPEKRISLAEVQAHPWMK